jgi:two-component system chemotaxis sensor kinase CheA
MDFDREALMQVFRDEASEGLAAMEQAVLELETRPDDAETLGALFRHAHTLKGNAASLGLGALADFAHVLEDLLERLREGRLRATTTLATLLLRAVDALEELLPLAASGVEGMPSRHQDLLGELRNRVSAGTDAAPVEPRARPVPDFTGVLEEAAPNARRTLRVDLDKLDSMLNLVGELAVARGRLGQTLLDARAGDAALDAFREAERLSDDLQNLVLETRMVALGPTFRQFARTLRDLATARGKQARLVVEGGEVEVDTRVIEKIRDPLTHMVRNALDHGVEGPEERRALGKDPLATVALRARHAGRSVVIELSDDGAGLRRERILERARERGLVGETQALGEREVHELIFRPGLSTADGVTELSGRGVGMDVVRRNVAALRGSVEVWSREGLGTTFTIRLPLTLAVIQGFLVSSGGERYVVPLDAVQECLDLPGGGEERATGVLDLRGEPVPYLRLRHALGAGGRAERESVVVVTGEGGDLAGLAVDAVLGERQVVIKPLDRSLHGVAGLAGCTILGDGQVALILDVPALLAGAARTSARPA